MGERNLADQYVVLEHLESILSEMEPSSENLEGKHDSCMYESDPYRSRTLSVIFYYLRAKASLNDYDQLKEMRQNLRIHDSDFLQKHVVECKRCMRTLKIGLEKKPKLDKGQLEKLASILLLNDAQKKKALENEVGLN